MATLKPGERKLQILQSLAEMLESPQAEKNHHGRAGRPPGQVSEAALYRHFATKAQMYEGLIEFIETTLFGLINRLTSEAGQGLDQARGIAPVAAGLRGQEPGHDPGTDRRSPGQ
jgi:TetR/AcrR family transcriptional regulator